MNTRNTRLFIESDRTALRHLYLETRKHAYEWADHSSYQTDDFDRDTEGEVIWVTTIDDKPVGFLSVWCADNFIHNLYVHPSASGNGVGSSLLDTSLSFIQRPAALKCLKKNTKAIDFYVSRGWQIISEGSSLEGQYLLLHFEH